MSFMAALIALASLAFSVVHAVYGGETKNGRTKQEVTFELDRQRQKETVSIEKSLKFKTGCEKYTARDCQDILAMGMTRSGLYHVTPTGTVKGLEVYCDMHTDDGGWLVFQRRKNGTTDFYQDWEQYEAGFGNVSEEHWLGNLPLYTLTYQGHYELRVDLEDWEGNTAFASYRYFRIEDPGSLYRIIVVGYFGNAGDSLGPLAGQYFTTKDRDNDKKDDYNCAEEFDGTWWYHACHGSNLNGLYLRGNHTSYANGVNWDRWRGVYYSLKTTEMKIRRR